MHPCFVSAFPTDHIVVFSLRAPKSCFLSLPKFEVQRYKCQTGLQLVRPFLSLSPCFPKVYSGGERLSLAGFYLSAPPPIDTVPPCSVASVLFRSPKHSQRIHANCDIFHSPPIFFSSSPRLQPMASAALVPVEIRILGPFSFIYQVFFFCGESFFF